MAETVEKHRAGILAWYDFSITTGKLEGINNKIKVLKRKAYGYRDDKFFELKLLSLHDPFYAFAGLTKKKDRKRSRVASAGVNSFIDNVFQPLSNPQSPTAP